MNYYEVWVNLADSYRDVEFADAVHDYLGLLQRDGLIASYRLSRRKLGFGPQELGEFNIEIGCDDLAQLESAFAVVAARSDEVERLHARVYSMVTDFRAALYRDFPDAQRVRE